MFLLIPLVAAVLLIPRQGKCRSHPIPHVHARTLSAKVF